MIKRLWHLLFDDRYVALRRWRPFHCMKQEFVGGTAVGFDGCPACTFGDGRSCRLCDYDCCEACSYDSETRIDGNLISASYANQVCRCQGHVCGEPPVPVNFVIPDQTTAVDPSSVPLKPAPDIGGSNANV